jgi:hypothetical protein
MAKLIASSALVLALISSTSIALADEDSDAVADEAGVNPFQLADALATLSAAGIATSARQYLCDADGWQCPKPPGRVARVRLTYYVEGGLTASGGRTYAGSTACSYNWPFGTQFRFPDGEVVTCNDRGMLGSVGWLDVFRRSDLAARYGPYATVEVLP